MFRVEKSGYDSPRTTLSVLEEDANVCHEDAKTAPIDNLVDT